MLDLKFSQAPLEDLPVRDDITLIGSQGPQLTAIGATGEIGYGLFLGSLYQ
jgi:hypothetical protein